MSWENIGMPLVTSSVAAALVAALVNGLMNRGLQSALTKANHDLETFKSVLRDTEERLRSNLARERSADEAGLRVQAEVRLRLHDKSWSLLRDLTSAMYEAHRQVQRGLHRRAVQGTRPDLADAVTAVLQIEMLAASAPPEVDLTEMRTKLKHGLAKVQFEELPADPIPFYEEVANMIDDAIDLGKTAITAWNVRLWASAPKVAEPSALTQVNAR